MVEMVNGDDDVDGDGYGNGNGNGDGDGDDDDDDDGVGNGGKNVQTVGPVLQRCSPTFCIFWYLTTATNIQM